ncbi:hypothetical protein [Protofrankia symbiont of Coriaria ruscifolia]|uniref:Uncharacterized protein n=1 Tax=Candidatus Protofrankia californiensis TaxID=1839754 RepID=A0A1C3NW84_9ACTN|nr:hypothetical protein [Protofrankia symbiont of Coriaria ruscifolia]SBW20467.1 hypothetical protein FDG2_1699 [Candidatus Protofrankia californiensis]
MATAEITQTLDLTSARFYQIIGSDPMFLEPVATTLRAGKIRRAENVKKSV